jgi:hypothetical protein
MGVLIHQNLILLSLLISAVGMAQKLFIWMISM